MTRPSTGSSRPAASRASLSEEHVEATIAALRATVAERAFRDTEPVPLPPPTDEERREAAEASAAAWARIACQERRERVIGTVIVVAVVLAVGLFIVFDLTAGGPVSSVP